MKFEKNPIMLTIYLLLLYGFIEVISYDRYITSNIPNIFFVVLLLLVVLLEPKKSIYLLIPAFIFADDTSRFLPHSNLDLHSIWTIKLFGFTFPYLLVLALAYPLFIFYMRKENDTRVTKIDRIMFFLLLTYGVGMLSGLPNIFTYFKMYLSDIAPFVAIVIIYIFIRTFTRDEESIHTFSLLLIYSIGIKAVLGLIFFFTGYGKAFGTITRVTFESGRIFYTLEIFITAGILLFMNKKRWNIKSIFLLIFLFSSLFFRISYAGRMAWLLTIVGAGIFLYIIPHKKRLAALLYIGVGTFITLIILKATGMSHTLIGRLTTLSMWSAYGEGGETSTAVRIVEMINVWHTIWAHKRIFWGVGAGGYFTDKYFHFPFPLNLSDYRLEWIRQRTFFHTHIPIFNIFFKGGLIAFTCYIIFSFKLFFFNISLLKKVESYWWKGVFAGFISFYPEILTHNWSTKQNMMIGIILGILGNLELIERNKNRDSIYLFPPDKKQGEKKGQKRQ